FALALLATAAARFPQATLSPAGSFFAQISEAFAAASQRGLLRLAGYTTATYLPGGFVVALATPLLLSVTTPRMLGVTSSVMGTGAGRGMALLVLCGGLAKVAVIMAGARSRRLRRLDDPA